MTDDKKRIATDIEVDTHAVLMEKLEHGELAQELRDVANTLAYGGGWDRKTLIDRRIDGKQENLRDLRDQRRKINAEIETKEDELEELRRERERVETKAEQFEGALWSFEQSFRAGEIGHLHESHARLEDFADEFDKPTDEIYNLLVDRNPDVPGGAFKQRMYAERRFDGLNDEQARKDVEERE